MASNYDETTNIVELDGYIDTTQRDNLILSGNVIGDFQTGSIGHTVIFGAEYVKTNSDQDRYNPTFSTTLTDRETFNATRPLDFKGMAGVNAAGDAFTVAFDRLNDETNVTLDVYSFYVQDEIHLSENFDLVLGARFDSFDIEVIDVKNLATDSRKDEEVSPRAGLIYKPQENISIYAEL